MNTPPDFYLYQGEGIQPVLAILRACRKIAQLEHRGQAVTLAAIEPPIPLGVLPAGISRTVIGFSRHGPKAFEQLKPGEVGSALVWEVYEFGGGKLGVGLEPSIGRATIYKTKPALDSQGNIIEAPAAARAFVSSIIRALESGTK